MWQAQLATRDAAIFSYRYGRGATGAGPHGATNIAIARPRTINKLIGGPRAENRSAGDARQQQATARARRIITRITITAAAAVVLASRGGSGRRPAPAGESPGTRTRLMPTNPSPRRRAGDGPSHRHTRRRRRRRPRARWSERAAGCPPQRRARLVSCRTDPRPNPPCVASRPSVHARDRCGCVAADGLSSGGRRRRRRRRGAVGLRAEHQHQQQQQQQQQSGGGTGGDRSAAGRRGEVGLLRTGCPRRENARPSVAAAPSQRGPGLGLGLPGLAVPPRRIRASHAPLLLLTGRRHPVFTANDRDPPARQQTACVRPPSSSFVRPPPPPQPQPPTAAADPVGVRE